MKTEPTDFVLVVRNPPLYARREDVTGGVLRDRATLYTATGKVAGSVVPAAGIGDYTIRAEVVNEE